MSAAGGARRRVYEVHGIAAETLAEAWEGLREILRERLGDEILRTVNSLECAPATNLIRAPTNASDFHSLELLADVRAC